MSRHPHADALIWLAGRRAPDDWTGPAYQLGYLMAALRRMDALGLTPAQYVDKWCVLEADMSAETGDTGDTGDNRATTGAAPSPVAGRGPGTPGTREVGRHA